MMNLDSFDDLCAYVEQTDYQTLVRNALAGSLQGFDAAGGQQQDVSLEALQTLFDQDEYRESDSNSQYFVKFIEDIKNNLDQYRWIHSQVFQEAYSREILFGILLARLTASVKSLRTSEKDLPRYFNPEMFDFSGNEVYVDCGAFTGDSVVEFACRCPAYKRIYAYEAIPQIYSRCEAYLSPLTALGDVVLKNKAVYHERSTLRFEIAEGIGDSHLSDSGAVSVEAVSLDDDIQEQVTFIKMDIEGSEKSAIRGARNHISRSSPRMAICAYHLPGDLWALPRLILEINPGYDFLLRHYGTMQYYDTVLYCIPKAGSRQDSREGIDDRHALERYRAILPYLSYTSSESARHVIELEEAKLWLKSQIKAVCRDNARQNEVIRELRDWAQSLEQRKNELQRQLDEAASNNGNSGVEV